jgi:hypothetical protein
VPDSLTECRTPGGLRRVTFIVGVRLFMRREARKSPLPPKLDEAILRLARILARQAAREDHEREQLDRRGAKKRP